MVNCRCYLELSTFLAPNLVLLESFNQLEVRTMFTRARMHGMCVEKGFGAKNASLEHLHASTHFHVWHDIFWRQIRVTN